MLQSDAYIVPEEYGIDTLKLIETQVAEIEALRSQINKSDQLVMELSYAYGELADARIAERRAWEAKISDLEIKLNKAKRKRFAMGPIIGYTNDSWSAGIGITAIIFSF